MPLIRATLFIPLAVSGLLLMPRHAAAQIAVDGPPTPTAHTLSTWFQQHIPVKFQAHKRFEVQPLSNTGMDDYLHDCDADSDNAHSDNSDPGNNPEDDDSDIDGVFVDDPPQIVLRVPDSGQLDFYTFAHEYGHYVWFDVLSKDDRKRYKKLYEHQKSANHLITDYAAESVEEGFAEAFSYDINDPVALQHEDALSYQFLSRWAAPPPTP
ncbi:MAG: hypothetical protein ACRYFS_22915 [Janthinobacterium lividum]